MAQATFGSAGVSAREIDLSGPLTAQPTGIPAGIIGTSVKGPAFVPVTVGVTKDFFAKFGETDGKKFGPLAVTEWLKNAQAVTYLRVLGTGTGKKRTVDGSNAGKVESAGFVVGAQLPLDIGSLGANPYANSGGPLGRMYVLGCFMSESLDSTFFSDAGLQGTGSVAPEASGSVPIVRGLVMAPSGVILRLSATYGYVSGNNQLPQFSSAAPASSYVASDATASGSNLGTVVLLASTVAKQEFVMLMNGHMGTDPLYPNVITASFDMTAPNYFGNIFNKDPLKLQQAGHMLYSFWDINPAIATVTGTGIVSVLSGASAPTAPLVGAETAAFLTTASLGRDTASSTVPNLENFENRYTTAKSPWFISQKYGGTPLNLFRIHGLDDGDYLRKKVKLSVENISPSNDVTDKYGNFDVVVRTFDDRDTELKVLEQFRGVNLNPTSDRYIAKVIGDLHVFFDFDRNEGAQKVVIDGNYANMSNYVRVEVASDVDTGEMDPQALPMGFRGIPHLITSGTAPMTPASGAQLSTNAFKRIVSSPLPLRKNVNNGSGLTAVVNSSLYWGVQFEQMSSVSQLNAAVSANKSVENFGKYLPDFQVSNVNAVVSDNQGAADTDANGIVDADRFCFNRFTLENLQVTTGSDTYADPTKWVEAKYVRRGTIASDVTNKTRGFSVTDLTVPNRRFAKFSTVMVGGFDGVNIFDEDTATMTNNAVTEEMNNTSRGSSMGPTVRAYLKALEIAQNTTDVDVQLLAIPGLRHSIITDSAIVAVENRFDALYIMDIEEYDNLNTLVTSSAQLPSVSNTVTQFRNRALDSSFGAAYYPDLVIPDPTTKTNVVVPPSVAVLGAISLNDNVAFPWFAPAGFTRGQLTSALEAKVKLSKANMDNLYEADVNPLVAFPGNVPATTQGTGGVVIWGQKTLQVAQSALDRVNVRRLLIDIRRQVREIANGIIFEPNRASTLTKFANAVNPRLKKIQAQQGLDRFKVRIDTSTTTQADVENNTIRGKIFLQPTKSIEFVALDFVVTNQGSQV